jgi:hypothetical protein
MIIEFDPNVVVSWAATGLSLLGNWYVISLDNGKQKKGYWIWLVSNTVWISYFLVTLQWAPLTLFTAYFLITVVALYKRYPAPEYYGCGSHMGLIVRALKKRK